MGYHASLNRALRTYLSAEYNLETSRHEGLDIIENAVDSLDPRSDRQRFMEMYPTAFCPPAKFEFQSHMGDEVCLTNVLMWGGSFVAVSQLICVVADGEFRSEPNLNFKVDWVKIKRLVVNELLWCIFNKPTIHSLEKT